MPKKETKNSVKNKKVYCIPCDKPVVFKKGACPYCGYKPLVVD